MDVRVIFILIGKQGKQACYDI